MKLCHWLTSVALMATFLVATDLADRKAPERSGSTVADSIIASASAATASPGATIDLWAADQTQEVVYITPTGIYHRKECGAIHGIEVRAVRPSELPANATPCPLCKPLIGPSTQTAASPTQSETKPSPADERVVVITGTGFSGLYHRENCPVLKTSGGLITLTRAEAEARFFRPHSECMGGTAAPAQATTARTPAAPTTGTRAQDNGDTIVYITRTGTKYHRAGCRSLARSQTPIALRDAVARGSGPCSICNPPTLSPR